MMHDLEKVLEKMKPARPGAELDQRMKRLFDNAIPARPSVFSLRIPLWQAAAGCAMSLAFGFLLNNYVESKRVQPAMESKTIVVVPVDESLQRVFDLSRSGGGGMQTANSVNRQGSAL